MIKAVIWDFGGVILRTETYAPRQALADRLGISIEDLDHLVFSSASGQRAQTGEITIQQHWEAIQRQFKLDDKGIKDFRRDFFGGDFLDHNLLQYIQTLCKRYKIGLLSNAFSNLRVLLTDTWKIADYFDDLLISAEVGLMKPEKRIYQLSLERLDVQPREAVFIDDFQRNIDGAQAVGINTVHFRNSEQAIQDLEIILSEG